MNVHLPTHSSMRRTYAPAVCIAESLPIDPQFTAASVPDYAPMARRRDTDYDPLRLAGWRRACVSKTFWASDRRPTNGCWRIYGGQQPNLTDRGARSPISACVDVPACTDRPHNATYPFPSLKHRWALRRSSAGNAHDQSRGSCFLRSLLPSCPYSRISGRQAAQVDPGVSSAGEQRSTGTRFTILLSR